jgi:adenine phosphoribosyltransferase
MTAMPTETFTLTIGDLSRELPLVRPTPTTRLPLVEFLGDTQLAHAAAKATVGLIPEGTEVLFTCETSSGT